MSPYQGKLGIRPNCPSSGCKPDGDMVDAINFANNRFTGQDTIGKDWDCSGTEDVGNVFEAIDCAPFGEEHGGPERVGVGGCGEDRV